jgi:tetratricopeptide (TPR) repeat protein
MKKIICFFLPAIFLLGSMDSISQEKPKGVVFASTSNEAMLHFNDGLKYNDLFEGRKARDHFQKAIERDPKFISAYLFLADNATNAGEYVSSLNKAKLLIKDGNEWDKLYYSLLETGLRNDLNERLKIAEKMVQVYPQSARAHFILGETYQNLHKISQARAEYTKAIQLESTWPSAQLALSNSYMTDAPKDLKVAEAIATSLLKSSPETSCHLLLGDVYRQKNDFKKAEETYTKAILSDPESAGALMKRGHARTLLSEYETARADFDHAAKLDANPVAAKQYYAYTYLYEGMPGKAFQELSGFADNAGGTDEAAKVNAQMAYLGNAALIALHMGDVSKLESVNQKLGPLRTRNALIIGTKEAEIEARSGEIYWNALVKLLRKDLNEAKSLASQLKLNVEPLNNPRKYEAHEFLTGFISYHEGDFTGATEHIAKANPSNIYHRYWLARSFESGGKKDKATSIYKELADYNFNSIANAIVKKEVLTKVK